MLNVFVIRNIFTFLTRWCCLTIIVVATANAVDAAALNAAVAVGGSIMNANSMIKKIKLLRKRKRRRS